MRSTRIVLTLLVVLAPILGAVTVPAAAAEDDYSKTFEGVGDTKFVGIDTEGWGADTVRVIISTENGPGDTFVELHNRTYTTAKLQSRNSHQLFANQGAYETITIEVRNAQNEPEFVTGAETKDNMFLANWFASTGGDRDLVADFAEKMSMAVNPRQRIVDVTKDFSTINESNLQNLDANETKLEIYQSAASSADTAENVHAIMNNHLQDAETVALIKGKNAYVRDLNAHGSKTSAKSSATQNISEFYSRNERNLISQWNSQISTMEYLRALSLNETGVPDSYVRIGFREGPDGYGSSFDESATSVNITGFGSTSFTLQNGSSVSLRTIEVEMDLVNDAGSHSTATRIVVPGTTGYAAHGFNSDEEVVTTPIMVGAPNKNLDKINVTEPREYNQSLQTIDSQTASAQNQMDTVVNQTFDQYQAGLINSSDLVDPYMLHNQFNPGDEFQGWAAATLALTGSNQPTNYDQTGHMNVTLEDGTHLQGILHAPHNPLYINETNHSQSDGFVVNYTYNPGDFSGPIYLTTDSRIREIQQNFTLDDVRTVDGESRTNVTYVEKTYNTTSADDLEKLNEQMAELRAEIEAREQASAGGGPIFGSGSGSMLPLVLIAAGVVAILLQGNNSNGGNGGSRSSSNGGGSRSRRRY